MTERPINSILAIDCGSATTTAILIELVNGTYQLVATGQTSSTYDSPWQDITLGVTSAMRQIEKVVGRTLLGPGGWPMTPQKTISDNSPPQGVDAFLIVSSAGQPLQIALVGLMEDITLASARRAAATTYTSVTHTISLDAQPEEATSLNGRHSTETDIRALQNVPYEVILLVGGTDNGAEEPVIKMANVLSMAMRVLKNRETPTILYGGNNSLRSQIAEILGSVSLLKAVDNVRPILDGENLTAAQLELEKLYIQRKISQLPGFEKLSNWSSHPIIPANKSFDRVVAYLGRHNSLNVIGVNVGSQTTVVSTQAQTYHNLVCSDAGQGHGLASLLKATAIEKFHRWLTFPISPAELYNRLLNKSLHPTSLPTTPEDLEISYAVTREALRLAMAQSRTGWPLHPAINKHKIQWNLAIGAGRPLTHAPHRGYATLMMLDGLEPWGVTSLALDSFGVTNMLGLVAAVEPVAAVEIARNSFLNLGAVIAPLGHGLLDETALKLKITYHNRSVPPTDTDTLAETTNNVEEIEVPYGTIEIIPLPEGQKATVEIRPGRHFDIGLGQPGRGAVADVEGGLLGIIVDARGRPLRLPSADDQRYDLLTQWISKLDISV